MKINVKAAKNAWMFALLKCLKWLMGNPPRLMQKNVLAVKAALRFVKSAQSPSKKPDQTASLALNQVPGKLFFQIPPGQCGLCVPEPTLFYSGNIFAISGYSNPHPAPHGCCNVITFE
jgi:hypothetical protein